MIEMENVSFSTGSTEVRGLSFRLGRKEKAVVLGPRFSGKSDLLLVCLGAHPYSDGTVRLFGQTLDMAGRGLPPDLAQKVGFVGKNSTLLDNLTVSANVGLPLSYHTGLSARETADKIGPLLERFEITKAGELFPHQISDAEVKLAMMARALVFDPEILLIDEPTNGDLDPNSFVKILRTMNSEDMKDVSLLVTTSSPSVATMEGAASYCMVDGALIPRSELGRVHNVAVDDFMGVVNDYSERQANGVRPFYAGLGPSGKRGTT
ncbi:MAG: ATP-binding cassette domain-containing protein [Nitrospinae bacterium]|nr:ATP-binding cassette domain-containing protein [Nitrospinota bacterium]